MRKLINFHLLVMISFILYSCNVNQDDKIEFNESNEKVWSDFEGVVDSEIVKEFYFEPNVSII